MSKVTNRNEYNAALTPTRIWQELADERNPYVAHKSLCHGYDHFDLCNNVSFAAMLFLLFRGELPEPAHEKALNYLLVMNSNLGPRHSAVRAAMLGGAGRTEPMHYLPIGLSVLGGTQEAGQVEPAMHFIVACVAQDPSALVRQHLPEGSDVSALPPLAPGFGQRFGRDDPQLRRHAAALQEILPQSPHLDWGVAFVDALATLHAGWLRPGLVAACLLDLGFQPRGCGALYQLLCAPGIAAHGLEMRAMPRTAMPFLDDSAYEIE